MFLSSLKQKKGLTLLTYFIPTGSAPQFPCSGTRVFIINSFISLLNLHFFVSPKLFQQLCTTAQQLVPGLHISLVNETLMLDTLHASDPWCLEEYVRDGVTLEQLNKLFWDLFQSLAVQASCKSLHYPANLKLTSWL